MTETKKARRKPKTPKVGRPENPNSVKKVGVCVQVWLMPKGDDGLEKLDRIVSAGKYKNRTEAIRALIQDRKI